ADPAAHHLRTVHLAHVRHPRRTQGGVRGGRERGPLLRRGSPPRPMNRLSVWTKAHRRASSAAPAVGGRLAAVIPGGRTGHVIDRMVVNIEHGRFERSLAGLTAAAAVVTAVEIYLEHYRASFGNKWMWSPIIVTPPVVIAGAAGVVSRRWAK